MLETAQDVRTFVRVGKREISASQLLERFGFRADKQWTPVGELSGGERRRLQLLRLLMDEPNVLLLDEPTNDLDIETLTELEDLLDGWPGFADGGQPRPVLPGTGHRPRGGAAGRRASCRSWPVGSNSTWSGCAGPVRPSLPAPAATAGPSPAPADGTALGTAGERAARKELQRLERQIDRLSGREAQLGVQMAENASDYEKLTQWGPTCAPSRPKAALEERWLSVAAGLEV